MKICFTLMLSFLLISNSLLAKNTIEKQNNNHFATFFGITTNTHNRNSDFTVGLDYEYILPALNNTIGFGLYAEYVNTEHSEYLIGLPIFYHLDNCCRILFAPSIAMSKEESLEKNELTMMKELKTKNITKFLIRIGSTYDFHINSFTISPTFLIDYAESEISIVYGLGFGISF